MNNNWNAPLIVAGSFVGLVTMVGGTIGASHALGAMERLIEGPPRIIPASYMEAKPDTCTLPSYEDFVEDRWDRTQTEAWERVAYTAILPAAEAKMRALSDQGRVKHDTYYDLAWTYTSPLIASLGCDPDAKGWWNIANDALVDAGAEVAPQPEYKRVPRTDSGKNADNNSRCRLTISLSGVSASCSVSTG